MRFNKAKCKVDEKQDMSHQCDPEGQSCPGLHQEKCGHRVREGILPLCPALLRPPREFCVQLWSPQHRKDLELVERGQRRPQR